MKNCKTLLVLFCFCCAFPATGQFQKGTVLLEGNAGFTVNFKDKGDGEDFKQPYHINLGVRSGYFFNEKNEIGIGLSWGKSRGNTILFTPNVNILVQTQSNVSPSLYWRTYKSIGDRLLLSFSTGADMSFTKFSERDFGSGATFESELFFLRIGFIPSLAYMLNSKLGLRGNFGNLGFNFSKNKRVDFWEKSFSANFSPQFLNFGLFLVLNGATSND